MSLMGLFATPVAAAACGDRGRDVQEHAPVERLRDEVLAAELEALHAVGAGDGVRHVLLREVREGLRGGELHRLVDLRRAAVERAAEDEREAEDVVDLVRIVRRGPSP